MRDFHLALMILLWKCRQNTASMKYNVPGNDYTPRVIFMLRFQMDIFWYQNYKLALSLFSCLFEKNHHAFYQKFIKSGIFIFSDNFLFLFLFFFFAFILSAKIRDVLWWNGWLGCWWGFYVHLMDTDICAFSQGEADLRYTA